ncbi:MAG: efflux transporter outer membrane subunit [Candidatus Latescibacterota bacterium]|nr:MAG: efflux transporter outer membrane subunit [Candidatus Latescibacterota bacterium]
MKRLFFLITVIYVAGCTMGPDYERPPIDEPVAYRDSFPPSESIANIAWWELFGDTVLQSLIDTALVHNRNLRASMARIDEARATLGIVRADLFPRLNYAADGVYEGTSAGDGSTSSSALIALNASYVVDLWGRVRRSNEAALAELLATEEAYRGVTITLVAEVANAYFLLRDLDNRLTISEQTAEAWRQSLDVVRSRYEAGMVSEVDVNQAEIQVYEADVSVQTFRRLRAQTENAISVLLGKPPMSIERGLDLVEQVLPPDVPAGLPSELLARRPDIRESEHRLHAQTARIGVAEAYKFPQFDLTGDLGASFNSGTSGFFGLGAQIFGPLFNSGEFQRRVDVEVARTEQLINSFEQTILNAYREVDDALVAVRTYKSETEARRRQLASAENAAILSWVRYEGGMTSYLEVLDLQRSLFSSQLKVSETYQLQLTSVVQLYQALGGGWIAEQDSMAVSGSSPPENDSER